MPQELGLLPDVVNLQDAHQQQDENQQHTDDVSRQDKGQHGGNAFPRKTDAQDNADLQQDVHTPIMPCF